MGLGFDLTRQQPDITPYYLKPTAEGLYEEISGNGNATGIAVGGTIVTNRYFEEDACILLNGTSDYIVPVMDDTQRSTALTANLTDANKAGQRLIAILVPSALADGNYGLYDWSKVSNASVYERLWLNVAAGVVNLRYKFESAGSGIVYDLTRTVTLTANIWHVFQVHHSNSAGNPTVTLTHNGSILGATANSAVSIGSAFTSNTTFTIGRTRNTTNNGYYYFSGYIGLFLIRKGLQFSNYWTQHPTTPAWSKPHYSAGNLVAKSLGDRELIEPAVFPENPTTQGVPCFKTIRDRCYVAGIDPNKRISIACPQDSPTVTQAAGTPPGDTWKYRFTFFDTDTGMESCFGPLSLGAFYPTLGGNHVLIDVPTTVRVESTVCDRVKVYKVNPSGTYYYFGMMQVAASTLTDNFSASSNLTAMTVYDDEDMYVIDDVGVKAPDNATVTVVAGGTLDNPGTYDIAINIKDTLLNRLSNIYIATGFATTGVNKTLRVSVDTTNFDQSGRYSIQLYIRKVGSQNYFYRSTSGSAGQITTNTTVVTASSTAISGESVIDPSLIRFPTVDYLAWHYERLFGAGIKDDLKNKLIFSELGNFEIHQPLNNFIVGSSTRPITGLLSHLGDLLILKETEVWKLVGNNLLQAQLFQIADNAGTISHNSIVVAGDYAFWMGISNVFMYDGNRVIPIGDDIADMLRTMDSRARSLVSAAVDIENGLVLFSMRRNPSVTSFVDTLDVINYNFNNDTILCYNYADSFKSGIHQWSTWNLQTSHICSGNIDSDSKQKVYYVNMYTGSGTPPMATHKSGYGFLDPDTNLDMGNPDSNGPVIIWESVPVAPNISGKYKFDYVRVEVDNEEAVGMTVGYKINGNLLSNNYGSSSSEHFTKKVAARARFIAPYIQVDTLGKNARLLATTVIYSEVENR